MFIRSGSGRCEALRPRPALFLFAIGLLSGCSGNDTTKPPASAAHPPAAVRDLRADSVSSRSLVLHWTAPPTDGESGRAAFYDLRYAPKPDSGVEWWDSARSLAMAAPESAGVAERVSVGGLLPETSYVFALKAADADSNWSDLSNVLTASCQALPDTIPPAAVRDLWVDFSGSTVITLTWSAPGDDGWNGRPARYEVRRSLSALTDSTWSAADTVGVPFAPGLPESGERLLVRGLAPNTTYYFGVRAIDDAGNVSALGWPVTGSTSAPATYFVPSLDFSDLPSVLSATVAGDRVVVEAGTYPGGIVVPDHRYLSARGEESVLLQGAAGGAAVTLETGSVLDGFTIRGEARLGLGIDCRGDSVLIRRCRVESFQTGVRIQSRCRLVAAQAADCFWGFQVGEAPLAEGVGKAGRFGKTEGEASAVFENCLAERNSDGIQAYFSSVKMYNSTLRGNGLGAKVGPRSELFGCTIQDNTAAGVILVGNGESTLRYCMVSGNGRASSSLGGVVVHCDSLVMEGCTVAGNGSYSHGGGMTVETEGGAVRVARSFFIGNSTEGDGGGIFVLVGSMTLAGCTVSGNSARRNGGGIHGSGPIALEECTITGNAARKEGGGVFTQGLLGITSCTIAGNRAPTGGGVALEAGHLRVERSILSGNCNALGASDAYLAAGSYLTLACSSLRPEAVQSLGVITREGPQVETDPLFVSPTSCEEAPTDGGDWRLRVDSPCLPDRSPCGDLIGAPGITAR